LPGVPRHCCRERGQSGVRSCISSSHWRIRRSTKWSSEENFRAASSLPSAASCGSWPRLKPGLRSAEAPRTPIRPIEARQFVLTDAADSVMPSEANSCVEGGQGIGVGWPHATFILILVAVRAHCDHGHRARRRLLPTSPHRPGNSLRRQRGVSAGGALELHDVGRPVQSDRYGRSRGRSAASYRPLPSRCHCSDQHGAGTT
jgi:hypothetical protein